MSFRYNGRMTTPTHIRLFGTAADSIVDGPGLRYAVFTQGCSHRCAGCHNPESWPFEGGTLTSIDDVVANIQANKLIQGVTLSGGDPFCQPAASAELARRLKELGYNVWVYTGYEYEDLVRLSDGEDEGGAESELAAAIRMLLENADVLVDGPFVESLKSLGLKWRGSANQRVIDMAATRKAGRIVRWEAQDAFPTKPASW